MNRHNYLNLPSPFPPEYAAAWGEDVYGLWFDLLIKTEIQRFRWIPAGEFIMGSPKSEKQRETLGAKETQHLVRLSQGYWLADTACTQALWLAVMGENPADFSENLQNPVENVSWLDRQTFLQRIKQQSSDYQLQLPSEAQWEYACRAGMTSPFSFGDNISSKQVNYDGTKPYTDAEKSEYRKKTVAVKSLPANPWGLYEMHGNVWEWCQDEFFSDLGAEAALDPVHDSTDKSVSRVLRGGSWFDYGWYCRSAMRYDGPADFRDRYDGFRFSLGHELLTEGVSRSEKNR